jgi:hypothetical protein
VVRSVAKNNQDAVAIWARTWSVAVTLGSLANDAE